MTKAEKENAEKENAERVAKALANFGEKRRSEVWSETYARVMRDLMDNKVLEDFVGYSNALNSLLPLKVSRSTTYTAQFSGENHGTQKSGDVQKVLPKRPAAVKPKP